MLRRAYVPSTAYGLCKWSIHDQTVQTKALPLPGFDRVRQGRRGKAQHVVCLCCDLTQKVRKYGPRGGSGMNPVRGRAQVVSPAGQGLPSHQISGTL